MGKNGNRYGEGTFIERKMFLSPAFMSLGKRGSSPVVSNCSAQVLILLLGKRAFAPIKKSGKKVYERSDDNKLDLTYKELASRGINQQRATRSIDELLAKGFIEVANPGGLFEKDKALYSLSEDYRFWKSDDPPIRKRSRDVKRGYQGKGLGATSKGEKNKLRTRQRGTPTRTSTGDTL